MTLGPVLTEARMSRPFDLLERVPNSPTGSESRRAIRAYGFLIAKISLMKGLRCLKR
jgi:hypothetical protein